MRATRSDRSSTYTLVPQSVSDEDEGVYEESPESSQQHTELLSADPSSFTHSMCCSPDRHELKSFSQSDRNTLSPSPIFHPATTSQLKLMSPARKCCFVASLFACVAYVVALLWLIPCHLMPCFNNIHTRSPIVLKEWTTRMDNTIGGISEPRPVVIGPNGESVLIFAFQLIEHNVSVMKTANSVEPACGVMALSGTDGREMWRQLFYTQVEDVVCNITDVNQDDISDCAIVGSMGLLAAINASNGHTFWYLHNHDEQPLLTDRVSSPCPLKDTDMNGDGVKDLMVLSTLSMDYSEHETKTRDLSIAQLLLVSGSNGEIIGQPVPCPYYSHHQSNKLSTPSILKLPNSTTMVILVSKGCHNSSEKSDSILTIGLQNFMSKAMEERSNQLLNNTYITANQSLYEEFCLHGEILSVISDSYDYSNELLLIVTHEHQTTLTCYQYTTGFQMKWTFHKEDYTIKDAIFGHFQRQKVAMVSLQSSHCTPTDCPALNIALDVDDGHQLHSLTTDCPATKLLLFGREKPDSVSDIFLIETAKPNNSTFNSSLTFLTNQNNELTLDYAIDLQQKTTCDDSNKTNAYTVVRDNGFLIMVTRLPDETSIRTISIRTRIPKKSFPVSNILVHPNLT